MSTKPKQTTLSELKLMLSGFQQYLPTSVKSVPVIGDVLTPTQVEAKIEALLPPFTAADDAKAAAKVAVAARKEVEPAARALLEALRSYVKQLFAKDPVTMAKFGVTITPRKQPSALAKAAAHAKSTATRKKNKPAAAVPPAKVVLLGADGNPIGEPVGAPAAPAAGVVAK